MNHLIIILILIDVHSSLCDDHVESINYLKNSNRINIYGQDIEMNIMKVDQVAKYQLDPTITLNRKRRSPQEPGSIPKPGSKSSNGPQTNVGQRLSQYQQRVRNATSVAIQRYAQRVQQNAQKIVRVLSGGQTQTSANSQSKTGSSGGGGQGGEKAGAGGAGKVEAVEQGAEGAKKAEAEGEGAGGIEKFGMSSGKTNGRNISGSESSANSNEKDAEVKSSSSDSPGKTSGGNADGETDQKAGEPEGTNSKSLKSSSAQNDFGVENSKPSWGSSGQKSHQGQSSGSINMKNGGKEGQESKSSSSGSTEGQTTEGKSIEVSKADNSTDVQSEGQSKSPPSDVSPPKSEASSEEGKFAGEPSGKATETKQEESNSLGNDSD